MSNSNLEHARETILDQKYTPFNRKGILLQDMLKEGWEFESIDGTQCVMTRVHSGFHYTRTITGTILRPKIMSEFYRITKKPE